MFRTMPFVLVALAVPVFATAADDVPTAPGARVHNLKALSNHVDDVTTVENILKSFVKPGMSDQKRAQALWTAAVRYRHQTAPPDEQLAADWEAHDPVKIFNTYGYCMCCCCSSILEALNRADGREARGRILSGHSVPETFYNDSWHMFDCSLITQFPKPNGVVASVDEISDAINAWYKDHPEYKGSHEKLVELMRKDGWMGWKSGPPLLADCPYYRMGFFPAGTHGWDATMTEYAKQPAPIYEYGYQTGHKALFSLRPGESFTREAGNRGLHVNMDKAPDFDMLKAKAPANDLKYLTEFLPGYRGTVVANGVHRYAPNLAKGDLAAGAEVFENLVSDGAKGVHVAKSGAPGVAIVEMKSPYVYLGGVLHLQFAGHSSGAKATVTISTNNGRSFKPLYSTKTDGASEAKIELKDHIFRRYVYLLRIELTGSISLTEFEVANDFQHAPRTLPWLDKGTNTITVAADDDTALATRTVTGRITPDAEFSKNESSTSMGFTFDSVSLTDGIARCGDSGKGSITMPIEIPGDLVALRLSVQIRARDAKDTVTVLASTDAGKSWRELAQMTGPTQGRTHAFRFGDWPKGTQSVLVKLAMSQRNTTCIFNARADADYKDPRAAKVMSPFQIVHIWKESGQERKHTETISKLPTQYTIEAGPEPEMVSVSYEMPTTK